MPWPLIGWDIFDFFSEIAEQNSTKLDSKQDLNSLYQVCVFRADWKNKMAVPASDSLRHFLLLLWNRWAEFNKIWQEARSQCPLPSFCFSGRWVNKNCHPGRSVKKLTHCTQVHDMWPFGPLVYQYIFPMIYSWPVVASFSRVCSDSTLCIVLDYSPNDFERWPFLVSHSAFHGTIAAGELCSSDNACL